LAKLPIFYRKSSEAIISFSFTDILSKTGYVTFYGLNQYKAAAAVYSLSPIKTSSFFDADDTDGFGLWTRSGANASQSLELDWLVSKTDQLRGNAFFTLPLGMVNFGGSPSNYTMAVSAGLYIDDGSETLIGAVVEKSFTAINLFDGGGEHLFILAGVVDISAGLKIKAGDIIRLKIDITAAGNKIHSNIYHDPKNLAGKTIPTDLTVNLPFKIEL